MSEAEVERIWTQYRDLQPSGVTVREERRQARQEELQAFVTLHGIKCFKCGSGMNAWGATGIGEYGRAWAICEWCVRKPRAAGVPPASAQNPANSE